MRHEVRAWVADVVKQLKPQAPVLEVGAYNVNGTIRDLFPQDGYVGLDMREGPGVDVVGDIMEPDTFMLECASHFSTVVCCETLEHIARPWLALEHMHELLRLGGVFIATWCFNYHIHEEPADYWRVTPAGFRYVLADVGFSDIQIDWEGDGPVGVFATARRGAWRHYRAGASS